MASDVSQNMPNADQAGEGGATLAAVIEAKTEPKGLTAHQPYQLSDAKWLVEEGKQCSYWIDVTISTANGLILIAKDLQSIDKPDLRWRLSAGSEELTRHATVDMDLTSPLTGAMVGTFRVVFFLLIRLPTPQARTELVQLFGSVGAAAIKQQMWWAVLFHPAYGQALVPISKCQKSAFKCTMPYTVDHASTSAALFKDITNGQNAGCLTACLADLKVRHRLLSFAELQAAVEAAGASSGVAQSASAASGLTSGASLASSAQAGAPPPPPPPPPENSHGVLHNPLESSTSQLSKHGEPVEDAPSASPSADSSTASASNGAGASAPATAMEAVDEAGSAKGSTAGEAGVQGATGGGASGGGADSNGGRGRGRKKLGQHAADGTGSTIRERALRQRARPSSREHVSAPESLPSSKLSSKQWRDCIFRSIGFCSIKRHIYC